MFELFKTDPIGVLAAGLFTGFVFGFLLQRGGVTRFRTIVGQFLWTDHTVLRTMLTAVVVGAVGIYAMHALWDVPLHLKAATVLGNAIGGVIFGVGMVTLGYCPGTGVAALGDGSRHAIPGVLGMLAGAAIYAETHGWMSAHVLKAVDLGKVTLADVTLIPVWVPIAALVVIAGVVFRLLKGRDLVQTV